MDNIVVRMIKSVCVYILEWMCQFHREGDDEESVLHNTVFLRLKKK